MAEKTYRIGEVARILNVRTSVLRYWEKEFAQVLPHRTRKGQRFYTEANVTVLRRIQFLLYERGMKIKGAKNILTLEMQGEPGRRLSGFLDSLTCELMAIRDALTGGESQ